MKNRLHWLLCLGIFFFSGCLIKNTKPEDCTIVETEISSISEGTSYDINFRNASGDYYYINRGLEQGLILEDIKTKVLNKTVTLHLAKVLGGKVTSQHIAQMAIGDTIIFTEFE
ncbi:MAG: hypothetical protein KJO77_02210 [Bacteroidia bacterium]|nr:hypothetical protein [Bacteroidia bacterium]NND51220.1 hypothetical protein [Flavobacteriaceae bacterium]